MSPSETIDVLRAAVWLTVKVGGPIMAVALLVGTLIGLFQALTSVQELTLTFAPKVLAILAAVWLLGDFMARALTEFLRGPLLTAMLGI
ncbi:MAG TPA: flagellar biosynthetic protein FliQ [Geminicoccaceae bacterium]|nr:flagellar biosynthetic protein FliQ [Geminicoccaceae bacterium]